MASKSVRVGLVQSCATSDAPRNLKLICEQIREAAGSGAHLIALPEAFDFLHPDGTAFTKYAMPMGQHTAYLAISHLAKEIASWILVGSISVESSDGKLANRSLLISPTGKLQATYDKIHLFDAAPDAVPSVESKLYSRGKTAIVANTDFATLGLSICYDLRFPHLFRALAQNGASILAIPSAFMQVTGKAHWHVLMRARAIETGCFVIAPAQCGSPHPGRESYGHSLIVNPWGEIIAEAGTGPEVVLADLDLSQVESARQRIPSINQDFDFDVAKIG